MPSKKNRNLDLVYDDIGAGPAIVFVHGHPFNRSMWKEQVSVLQNNYRLIIPDLRGYGESKIQRTEVVLLDEIALDLCYLMDELKIERALLVGLSMGGQIVMDFCRLFTNRVAGLVLADTDARAETEESYHKRLMLCERFKKDGMKKFTDEEMHKFISDFSYKNKPLVVNHLRSMMESTDAMAAAAVQRGRAERRDHIEFLSGVKIPVLVVVGTDDFFTPISTAQFMSDRIHGAELLIVDKAGHLPNMEQPEEFNKGLVDFIQRRLDF